MKIAAVIAEYNPFHNGHMYQLNAIRGNINADRIIVLMSCDFVQRGEPAIIDKYRRCEMALRGGADLVIEMPSYFALGSAEYFAQGAVSLLDKLGVVDILHFGSECGNINILLKYARFLADETPQYKENLNVFLKQGLSFPAARSKSLKKCFDFDEKILSGANNSLAIEYIKALLQRNSSIKPMTLSRSGEGYNSDRLTDGSFASANAIRRLLFDACKNVCAQNDAEYHDSDYVKNINSLKAFMPEYAFRYLTSNNSLDEDRCTVHNRFDISGLMFPDDFSGILHYRLLNEQSKRTFRDRSDLRNSEHRYYDVNETMENAIFKKLPSFTSFSKFALSCKSKNLTYSHISRGLMHIALNMTQENADLLKEYDYSQYARILGFTEGGKDILKSIKANSSIPIITKPSKALRELDGPGLISFKTDINVTNIYNSVRLQKITQASRNNTIYTMPNELTRKLIKL